MLNSSMRGYMRVLEKFKKGKSERNGQGSKKQGNGRFMKLVFTKEWYIVVRREGE